MNVLGIDTAGPVAGVALLSGGEVRTRTERVIRGADTRLMPWAQELAAESGMSLSQLDGVAVGAGPGAFTGLRVGLASALGLATALGVPVVPVDTLTSRAERWRHRGGVLLSALDARKGRLYASVYRDGVRVREPADVAPDVVLAELAPGFAAVGEGSVAYRLLVEAAGGRLVEEADDPGVAALVTLGEEALRRGDGLAPVDVRPTYLRDADAKRPTRR